MNLCKAREAYSYPASHIRIPYPGCADEELIYVEALIDNPEHSKYQFHSTKALDDYHFELLNSESPEDNRIGIASVIYWGNYLTKQSRNHGLAFSRANKFLIIDQNVKDPISKAKRAINNDDYGLALKEILSIQRLGISFGSKVLSFLKPDRIGVYDLHISRYFNDQLLAMETTGYYSNKKKIVFSNFCEHLQSKVLDINSSEQNRWRDRDGTLHYWRAVDVERAIFYVMQNGAFKNNKNIWCDIS